MKILALGDCNTLGVQSCKYNAFPEHFAQALNAEVKNLGHTMATSREIVNLYRDHYQDHDIITLSVGLTDSWRGFKYAPYVLYYPNNIFRKWGRKLVKKYKKWARKLGLTKLFGLDYVTSPALYEKNVRYVIENSKNSVIFLMDTLPKQQEDRNVDIVHYNAILDDIAADYSHVIRVKYYDYFHARRDSLYSDKTHLNADGYAEVTKRLMDAYQTHQATK